MATRRYDLAAKRFSRPADDRANLYVFRNGSASTRAELFVDGVPAGALGSYSYAVLTVRPGKHTLISRQGGADFPLVLEIHGGLNYYVAQRAMSKAVPTAAIFGGLVGAAVAAGISGSATPELELVDRPDGREGVRNCYLIAAVPPALPPMPRPPPDESAEADDRDLPPGW